MSADSVDGGSPVDPAEAERLAEAVRHDLYVRLHPRAENTTIHRTAELLTTDAGGVMVDYAASGSPLGLEVLGAVDVEVDGRRPVLAALDAARAEVERLAARLSAAELENAALRSAFTDAMGREPDELDLGVTE